MNKDIAFYSNMDDPEPWRLLFKKKGYNLLIWPNEISSPSNIVNCLTWEPPLKLFKSLHNLLFIQSLGAGVDHILRHKINKKIVIAKLIDKDLTKQLTEYAVMSVLMCQRNIQELFINQNKLIWKKPPFILTANNINILLLGYGHIGSNIAKTLIKLGYNLFIWKRKRVTRNNLKNTKFIYGIKSLDKHIRCSNIVLSILPSTQLTKNLINKKRLLNFKKNSHFVNIGRGDVVVEKDLLEALNNKKLSSAVLDVFHKEPLPSNSRLWKHPRVFITPHIAGLTRPSINNVENIIRNMSHEKKDNKNSAIINLKNEY